MLIDKCIIHNSGGTQINPYSSAKNETLTTIDNNHRMRFNFISQLGWFVGYTFIISQDGILTQTRLIGEEGAHTKGFNKDSIGICLIGNFSYNKGAIVDYPTSAQIMTLRKLLSAIMSKDFSGLKLAPQTEVNIPLKNIAPHRAWGQTACYGDVLDDNWARNQYLETLKIELSYLQKWLLTLQDLLRKRPLGNFTLNNQCSG